MGPPVVFAVCVGPLGFLVFLSLKVSFLQYKIISFNGSNSEVYVNFLGRLGTLELALHYNTNLIITIYPSLFLM